MGRSLIVLVVMVWCLHVGLPAAEARRRRSLAPAVSDRRGRAKARKHFRKGRRLFHKRRYQQAVWAFERAYQHWKHHSILFNLALSHALLGQKVQAGAYLRKYHKAPGKKRRRLPRVLVALKRQVATLIIKVADARAAIFVDGRRVGYGRVEVVVLAGKRVVEVRQGDRVVRRKELNVEAGTDRTWELADMNPKRATPEPGPRPDLTPRPTHKPLGRLHWAYLTTAASVTVALLGAALATSVLNRDIHRDFEARPWDESLAAKGEKMQLVANVMWGLTAAAAASTAVIAVFTRWQPSPENRAPVTLQAGFWPGGASLHVQW
jgi:hypothetical protein